MFPKYSRLAPAKVSNRPFTESKPYDIQGGSGGHGSTTGTLHQDVFDMHNSGTKVPIHGSHELSDFESEQLPVVSGSGERKRHLYSRNVIPASRHHLLQPSPRNALNSVSTNKSKLQQRSLSDENEGTDSDVEDSADRHDLRTSYNRSEVDSKRNALTGVSGSGGHNTDRSKTQRYESSETDDSDSQSNDSDSQLDDTPSQSDDPESQSEDLSSDSEPESETLSETLPVPATKLTTSEPTVALKRVVYFRRANSRLGDETFAELEQNLQAYLPDAKVMLETATNLRTAYSDRTVLNNLMSQILNNDIDEVLVADSNHLCNTKDGFNIFSWVCQQFGTKVFILPTLQSV